MKSKAPQPTTQACSALILVGLMAALSTGCTQEPLCPPLSGCGGPDPVGNWDLAPGYESCTEDLYLPPTDKRLTKPTLPVAGQPAPEPAVYDWCDLLINGGRPTPTMAGFYNQPGFFYESGQVGQANLRINADGTYTMGLARTGVFVLEFPAICVRMYGAMDNAALNPNDPMSPVGDVCKQLEGPVNDSGIGEGSYSNTKCLANPNDPGGCLCQFDVSETGGPFGPWRRNGNTVSFILQQNFPSNATFCNHGDTLDLTGADGEYLFGVKGLRTMKFKRNDVAPTP
ncbi:MAG TPA: hypothetical protein VHP33_14520 [Polyangiaceae bacterium]|nr:hypothetical protein [Polyangiaceae bacterium]